jgi:hypothetical protein
VVIYIRKYTIIKYRKCYVDHLFASGGPRGSDFAAIPKGREPSEYFHDKTVLGARLLTATGFVDRTLGLMYKGARRYTPD